MKNLVLGALLAVSSIHAVAYDSFFINNSGWFNMTCYADIIGMDGSIYVERSPTLTPDRGVCAIIIPKKFRNSRYGAWVHMSVQGGQTTVCANKEGSYFFNTSKPGTLNFDAWGTTLDAVCRVHPTGN